MADYGTANGLKNRMAEYTAWYAAGKLTDAMIADAYTDAQGQIDMKLSAVTSPPMIAPAWAVTFLDKIADDLAACAVLTQYYINKAPDESQELVRFCDKPLTALTEFVKNIKENPALLDPTATMGDNQILLNTLNNDRIFTIGQTRVGESIDDGGTMDNWNDDDD
jgi:hypothetical protein